MKLLKKIIIFATIVNLQFYISTGIMPILSFTFGSPDPETWSFPLPAKFVSSTFYTLALFIIQFLKTKIRKFGFFRQIFDIKTYSGYYASWILQMNASFIYFSLVIMYTSLQIGFSSYMDACAEDFKAIFNDLDRMTRMNRTSNGLETKMALKETIRIHNDMLK